MFKENDRHNEQDLFSPIQSLPNSIKKRLLNNWSKTFYEKIFKYIDEKKFSVLYSQENGAANTPVNILVGFEILKELFNHTDEVNYDRFLGDISFHQALGINYIEENYFSLRTLYHFRANLAEYEDKHSVNLLMDVFKDGRDKIISELGLKTGLQRMDSVMIAGNIKRMNRLMLFHKVLANLAKELSKFEKEINSDVKKLIKEDEDSISYRMKTDEVNMTIRKIALQIYSLTEKYKNDNDVNISDAYKKAIRLLSEQCEIKTKGRDTKLKLKPPEEISSGSLQNPADGDCTYRKKRDEKHWGYLGFASETCNKNNPMQVITEIDLEKNNVDDAKHLKEKLQEYKEETNLETMIADGGFHSPDISETSADLDIEIITTAIRGKKTDKIDILDSTDFKFDSDGLINSCPNGHHPIKQTLDKKKKLTASFDRRKCHDCPLNSKCIAYKSEKQSRLVVDANRKWLDKRRSELYNEDFIKLCRLRPAVEGLMEKIKPRYLNGRTRFKTLPRVKSRLILKATALNFKRYTKYIEKKLLESIKFIFQKYFLIKKNKLSIVLL